jgi:predicted metal-dependent hydrolase
MTMSNERQEEVRGSPLIAHRASLIEGVDLFNARRFWHAHEAWERIWLVAEGDERLFLQGLIQLAAAYHHVHRGTYAGGLRLFDAALEKLSRFPDGYLGIDRARAALEASLHRERIAKGEHIGEKEFPNIRYN